jgi:hypothetical protein
MDINGDIESQNHKVVTLKEKILKLPAAIKKYIGEIIF